jgi:hypothetical protein
MHVQVGAAWGAAWPQALPEPAPLRGLIGREGFSSTPSVSGKTHACSAVRWKRSPGDLLDVDCRDATKQASTAETTLLVSVAATAALVASAEAAVARADSAATCPQRRTDVAARSGPPAAALG